MSKKYSQLPAAGTPDGSEITAIVQGGVSKQITLQEIADLGGGGGGTIDHWRGAHAIADVYPAAGTGSGTAGAITAGDRYYLTVSSTLNGDIWNAGTELIALVNTPGSTDANWLIKA